MSKNINQSWIYRRVHPRPQPKACPRLFAPLAFLALVFAGALSGCDGDDSAPELTATEVSVERLEIDTPTNNLVSGRPMLRLGDTFNVAWEVTANGVAQIKLLFADSEFGAAPEDEQVFFRKRCPTADSCELAMSMDCTYTQERDIVCPDARGTSLQVFADKGASTVTLEIRARGRGGNSLIGFGVDFE